MTPSADGPDFPTAEISRYPYPHMTSARAKLPLTRALGRDDFVFPTTKQKDVRHVLSPVAWLPRLALEDTQVGDVEIPAGATVLCHLGSANRDEDTFTYPDAFEPQRENVKERVALMTTTLT